MSWLEDRTKKALPGTALLDDPAWAAMVFRAACDAAPVGLFLTDENGQDIYTNAECQRQMGLTGDESLGDGWQRSIHPDDLSRVVSDFGRAIDAGEVYHDAHRYLRPDGTVIEVMVKIGAVPGPDGLLGYVGVAEDITEDVQRRRAQEQTERLEAIGRLAGGIAHDFNNLLTVIMGFAEMLRFAPEDWDENTQEILQAATRAKALTHRLLAFASRQVTDPITFDPVEALRSRHAAMRRLIPTNVDFALVFHHDPSWLCRIDASQFEQLIINLVINARDAMPAGGKLTIELRNARLEAGEYVEVVVSDTGVGMSEDTIARVFEPFFTTKGRSGSGLGLATCHGIVRQAGGSISVVSKPDTGSRFRALLPRSRESRDTMPARTSDRSQPVSGNEVILLLEDEATLREVLRAGLASLGFRVHAATNGQEGVRLARELDHIDLVISDVVMPVMTGPEAVALIQRRHPSVAVLYTSGYAEPAIAAADLLKTGAHMLAKPFTPRDLARRIRAILDA